MKTTTLIVSTVVIFVAFFSTLIYIQSLNPTDVTVSTPNLKYYTVHCSDENGGQDYEYVNDRPFDDEAQDLFCKSLQQFDLQ